MDDLAGTLLVQTWSNVGVESGSIDENGCWEDEANEDDVDEVEEEGESSTISKLGASR